MVGNCTDKDLELRKLSMAVDQSRDWIVITDADGIIEYVNDTVLELTGYQRGEIIGHTPSLWKSKKHSPEFYRVMWETLKSGQPYRNIIINRKKNGELFYSDQSITPIRDEEGNITNFVSVGKDITQDRELRQRLEYVEDYDLLTGLPNRNYFQEIIEEWMVKKDRFALVITDISRLNYINETYGVETGDQILKECAYRLTEMTGNENQVARIGGDEFGLILDKDLNDIHRFLSRLTTRGEKCFYIEDRRIIVPMKAGVAFYPDDCHTTRRLISRANIALAGVESNNYLFYSQKLEEKTHRLTMLENRLHQALDEDEFEMHYQPYYSLQNGKRVGMEALLRWRRGNKLISPGEFIPVLEESGLIIPVGELIIKKVFARAGEWQLPIAINLSPVQFREDNFLERIMELTAASGIDPGLIGFEITETALMQNIDKTFQLLKDIKDNGFSIAVDDFGTGYSSLNYLSSLPLDYLKIDLSFIQNMTDSKNNRTIVEIIISLAHQLGLETIAEGVETEEQLEILTELQADIGQGFYWSRPLPVAEVETII